MSRIRHIRIRRFKGLLDVGVLLEDVTLLIGANNSGKSSVLQALHFACSIAQSARLVGEGVSWANDSFQLSINPAQLIYTPVADVMTLAYGGALQEPREQQIEIVVEDDDFNLCTVGLRRGRNRNVAVSLVGRQLGEQLMSLEQPFTVYAPGLAGIPKEERYLSAGVVRRYVARGDANLTLRNVLRMLSENQQHWDQFIGDMRSLFPGIEIAIHFAEQTDEYIQATFKLPNTVMLPIDAAGTSILQASQLLAYIALFRPRLLILDEPDSHLHPDNQRALCELVYSLASGRGFTAVLSSHSRHVFDALRDRAAVVWMNHGRVVEEPDRNTTAMLLDLGALDSVDYFADGELRCIVATEDTNLDPIRALLSSNGFDDDVEIASYAGCTKVDSAILLSRFLQAKAPHLKLVVHRDRDYASNDDVERFETRLGAEQLIPFVTSSNDVECYFLNAQHISALNPAITVRRAEQLIDQAVADTADVSFGAIVNLRTQAAFRNRIGGQGPPDNGAIAIAARTDQAADARRMARGKSTVGRLIALLQQELGARPRVYHPSAHLRDANIQALAAAALGQRPAAV